MSKNYILCVDDEKIVLNSLKGELSHALGKDFDIEIAESGEYGLELLEELLEEGAQVPVVISDQLMPGMKGDEFLVKVNKINPDIRKILLTGQASADAVGNALNNAGLYRFISKPWNADDLALTIKQAAASFDVGAQLSNQVQLNNVLSDINRYNRILSKEVESYFLAKALLENLMKDLKLTNGTLLIHRQGLGGFTYHKDVEDKDKQFYKVRPGLEEQEIPIVLLNVLKYKKTSMTLNNITQVAPWKSDAFIVKNKVKSAYMAPIFKKDEHLATLYFASNEGENSFGTEAEELLEAVIGQLGSALENTLLYENIKDTNEKMTDSINYAQRIQSAILPDEQEMKKRFPESFVLFKPKDIVSGDFYWFEQVDDYFYVCAIDCTGHGVPGAFMSMLANSLISTAIKEKQRRDVGEILTEMHETLIEYLYKSPDANVRDSMDVSLIRVDIKNKEIQAGAAKRPILIVKASGELEEHKFDRLSIGQKHRKFEDFKFTAKTFPLESGDAVYQFSDGITDQFGGKPERKFSTSRLKTLLQSIASRDLTAQHNVIENRFNVWKTNSPQTDDVILIGLRMP